MDELVNLKASPGPTMKRGTGAQKSDRKPRARKTNQTQPKKSTTADLDSKTQNCNGEFPEKPSAKDTQTEARNGYKVSEEQAHHDQAVETARPSVKTPVFSDQGWGPPGPDQIVSSSYLTLPSVLSDGYNFKRGNLKINGGGTNHYFLGIQAEEPYSRSFEGSKNMGSYKQQQSSEPSAMGTGFPVSLHQRLDSFGIPRQVVPESSSRDSNVIGLRMNRGAIRYDHFAPNNNFRSLFPN